MKRFLFAIAAVTSSVAIHIGVAAWFVPEQTALDVEGGEQQTAVFIMGQETFDALALGASEISEPSTQDAEQEIDTYLPQPEVMEAAEVQKTEDASKDEMQKVISEASSKTTSNIAVSSHTNKTISSENQLDVSSKSSSDEPIEPETQEEDVRVEEPHRQVPVPQLRPKYVPREQTATKTKPTIKDTKTKPSPRRAAAEQQTTTTKPEKKVQQQRNTNKATAIGANSSAATNATRGSAASKNSNEAKRGNAEASKYPGRIQAKIARTRRKTAGGSGTARVRFSISSNGRLSAVSIARSSGNNKVDAAALDHIRRAAPFPKPPPGARRTFVIPLQFKN